MSTSDSLLGQSPEEYGGSYSSDRLEIYMCYIRTAGEVSIRRQSSNSFFLTINTALVAFVGYLQLAFPGSNNDIANIPISLAGIFLCLLWYQIIKSYRDLNDAKFKVIHEIENYLPLRPFKSEWDVVGHGEDHKRYLPFTRIEMFIPWVFLLLYSWVLIKSILWSS